jgi:hypothetical protein
VTRAPRLATILAAMSRRSRPLPLAFVAAAALLGAGGCQKSLFPADTPRTQFERFDTMRAGAAPTQEPDVFGAKQPALRARLTPQTPTAQQSP